MNRIVITLLFFFMPVVSWADSDVKRQMVELLLNVMQTEKMIDAIYAKKDQVLTAVENKLDIKDNEKVLFEAFKSNVDQVMQQDVTWEKIKQPMINVYLKHYTEKEINDMLVFYSTETGKSVVNKMPLVMQDSILVSQSVFMNFAPNVKALVIEFEKELSLSRSKK